MRRALVALALAGAVTVPGLTATEASAAPARCEWLRPYLAAAGLPVETFLRISYRESGCARNGVRVVDRDDQSTSRFGLNFKGAGMKRYWARLCGATHWTQPGADVRLDVRCTAAAYRAHGLRPWR